MHPASKAQEVDWLWELKLRFTAAPDGLSGGFQELPKSNRDPFNRVFEAKP